MKVLKIKIREAKLKDFKKIKEIEYLSFKEPYSDYYMRKLIDGSLADLNFVAEVDEKIAGYIIARREILRDEIVGHILSIAVHPLYRKLGIGTKLMNHVLDKFKKSGVKKVYLEVRINNLPAIRMYEKLGFNVVDHIPKYYRDKEDALIMEKILD